MISNAGPDGIMIPDGGTFRRSPRGRRTYPSVTRGKIGASEDVLMQLVRWGTADKNRWDSRNQRFRRDQEAFQLKKPDGLSARVEQDIIILPDMRIVPRKMARLIARHPNIIDVPPAPGTDGVAAQKIENYCYLWDQAVNQRWMMGLHNPYRYDQAFFICLRGWGSERTMLRPADAREDLNKDPAGLWDHQVFDPANIYPYSANGEITRVTHSYKSTVGELKDDPFFEDQVRGQWDDIDDTTPITVNAFYWHTLGTWWHAVTSSGSLSTRPDSIWIKEPTDLGYNPWTLVLANGSSYGQTDWDDVAYLSEIGTGVLEDSIDTWKYMNRMATKLNELLSLEANPPASMYLSGGQVKTVAFHPGARNFFTQKDKVELHRVGPSLNDYQLLWDILEERSQRSGFPREFYGHGGDQGGFSATVLMAAGKDVLYPFTMAVNEADALKYRKVLEIYRDFGPGKPLRTKMQATAMGAVESAEITAKEIKEQGTFVEVTREDMTPQEFVARINIGLAQLREKAISLKRFRKEYAKIKNPDAENLDVLAEQVYLSEDVIKQLIPVALQTTGQDYLRKVWEMVQNPVPPPEAQGAGAMGRAGAPPGGSPALPPGLPPEVAAAMMGQPGLPPPGLPPGMGPAGPLPPGMLPPGMPMPGMPPGMPMPFPGMPPPGMPMGAPPPPGGAPGLPAGTMPPIMGGNLLTNTQLPPELAAINQILGQINGGAIGGAGGGGLPPAPGTTSPIPPFVPPGAVR